MFMAAEIKIEAQLIQTNRNSGPNYRLILSDCLPLNKNNVTWWKLIFFTIYL